ncbi:MAG: MnmC family methyltransferase [Verrucomicrobiota bacterium]
MTAESAYRLVQLANGTYSVHALRERETFHPVIGPVAEAEALYVRQLRLPERAARQTGELVIWDVGLGSAANTLTVLRALQPATCPVRIISFDHTLQPLEFGLTHAAELGYYGGYEAPITRLLQDHQVQFTDGCHAVHWEARLGDFPSFVRSPVARTLPAPHAILFDAYSPARNPEMWTLPLFQCVYQLLDPARPCGMPTYSRSTLLRVTLLLAGFYVGAGHATGEKEETTIAANSLDLIDEPLDHAWLQRVKRSTSAEPLHEPVYRQTRLSADNWDKLLQHPQFHEAL